MVLGVDREPVLLGRLRDPVRHRPRDGDAVVFEPQVPVQTARVVLLDDEPGPPLLDGAGAGGLGGDGEVALGAVAVELVVRHPRGLSRGAASGVEQTAASAQQIAASAQELSETAVELDQLVAQFRVSNDS